jgi:uncharacterized protein (DUF2236 family)
MHETVAGYTADGAAFRASDPELLDWVQATAAFGFCEAYHKFVRPLSPAEKDQLYGEGAQAAALYGAFGAPRSEAEREDLFQTMRPKLKPSPIIAEFISIMRAAPLLPAPMKLLQNLAIQSAVSILPACARDTLELGRSYDPPFGGAALLHQLGRAADRVILWNAPPAQSAQRMGLSPRALYSRWP